jgi:hypothetical protein
MVALKPIHKPANKQNISNHDGESSMANYNARENYYNARENY